MGDDLYSCPYCHGPCKLEAKDSKIFLICPKCGRREGTERLMKMLQEQKK